MLTSIGLLATAFGMSVASALIPVISVEIFVVGMVVKGPEVPWWLLALVVTIGQIGGKLLYYYAARGLIRLPRFMERKSDPEQHQGRWAAWLERFRFSCQTRPVWTGGVLLLSATASLPPFLATCVIAGWARVPVSTFLVTGLVGRFARFAALAVAPGVMIAWL
ncbi:YqaA family protein [Saccharopolyspora gloriosae]|uniref:YqaA family protein n=1 Tax=Saccharopolyspora gloriosae TaxID=455344 RepID=UPI001FB7B3C3|nr:VTT domain-containing protein [Saccharopolyspora gloriosae]